MEGRVDGDQPQGMGWWQLPLCQGRQLRASTEELKPKNLFTFDFLRGQCGLGSVEHVTPATGRTESPWLGLLGGSLAQMLLQDSPCTHKQSL